MEFNTEHARLGLSNHRWPHCPGSVRKEAAYPDVAGDAAIDGTGSHLLLEQSLYLGRCDSFLGKTIGVGHPDKPEGWLVEQDRINRVNDALAYVGRRIKEVGGAQVLSESRANPGQFFDRTDWWGTTDIFIDGISQKVLEVIDYKDGQLYVSEKDNPQLIGNAVGKFPPDFVYENYHDYTVRMTIIQPRISPPIRYVEMTVGELWEKARELAVAAQITDDPNAPLIAGDWCRWCKHGRAGNCPATTQIAMEGLAIMTQDNGKTSMVEAIQSGQISPGTMTESQIAAMMDAAAPIKKLIEQVEEEAMKRLEAGTPIPGYEIGTARNKKEWIDEEEVVAKKLKGMRFLKDEIYPAKLVTPAAALDNEKLSDRQKSSLQDMIKVVPGKAKVVKSSTPTVLPADMFDKLPESAPVVPDFMNVPDFM